MQDFKSKGTGNSRYLKSVSDFLTRYPSYEDFAQALVSGTLPIDLNGINPSGIDSLGTPYNVASVLQNSTCTKLGIPTTSTPNDAFNAIANGISGSGSIYVECDSDENNAEKEVTLNSSLTNVKDGMSFNVLFKRGNNVTRPYLTIRHSTGTFRLQIMLNATGYDSWYDYNISPYTLVNLTISTYYGDLGSAKQFLMPYVPHYRTYFYRGAYTGNGNFGSSSQGTPLNYYGHCEIGGISRSDNTDFCIFINERVIGFVDGQWYRGYGITGSTAQNNKVLYHTKSAAVQMNESGKSYVWSVICSRA